MCDNFDCNFDFVLQAFLSYKFSFLFWSTFSHTNFVYIETCRFAVSVVCNRETYVRFFDFESPEKLEIKSIIFESFPNLSL